MSRPSPTVQAHQIALTLEVRTTRSGVPGSHKGLNPFPRLQPYPCSNIYPSHVVPKPGSSASACCPRALAEAFPAYLPAHLSAHISLDTLTLGQHSLPLCPPTGFVLIASNPRNASLDPQSFSARKLLPLAPTPAEKNACLLPRGSGNVSAALRLLPP